MHFRKIPCWFLSQELYFETYFSRKIPIVHMLVKMSESVDCGHIFFTSPRNEKSECRNGHPFQRACTENTSLQNIWLWRSTGLAFGRAKSLWETETPLLRCSHGHLHIIGSRSEAIIWKQAMSDPLAALGEPQGEAGGNWASCGRCRHCQSFLKSVPPWGWRCWQASIGIPPPQPPVGQYQN